MPITLSGINRYPVKSMRGESLATATVEPWGLAGDRRWMLVDGSGEAVTAREHPRLLLLRPSLTDDGIEVIAPDGARLHVAVPHGETTKVSIFGRTPFEVRVAGEDASAWFSDRLGAPVRLVHHEDPRRRPTNPRFSLEGDCVSFADGYPLLLASESSLAALNGWIAEGPMSQQGPLPMRRFRPTLVVRGAPAWAEDGWRLLRIGVARFRVVKGCDRCVITTTDPDSAARGKEPIATLSRHRKWDGATWFAMNLIPDTPGARIKIGDEVEVLEAVDAPDGPPR